MKGRDILLIGYPSLDHVAIIREPETPNCTRIIEQPWTSPSPGGCPSNVAVAFARLGLQPRVSFAVGNDQESRFYLNYLRHERVNVELIKNIHGSMPHSYCFFTRDGEIGEVFFDPGACRNWIPESENLSNSAIDQVHWLVISVGPFRATRRLLEWAVGRKIRVVWLFKQDYEAFPKEYFPNLLSSSEIIFSNSEEARELCIAVGAAHERELLNKGPKTIVVTNGDQGANIFEPAGTTQVKAIPIEVTDPLGAGDAFAAGFIFGRYYGLSTLKSGRLGSVLASFVVSQHGAQTGLPGPVQVVQRYKEYFSEDLSSVFNERIK